MNQSPIKLVSAEALPLLRPTDLLSIDYPLNQSYQGTFVPAQSPHGNFELSGPVFPEIHFRGRKYKLLRVHIHEPSEHFIEDDETTEYEVHFVHVPFSGTLNDPKVVIGTRYQDVKAGKSRAPGGLEGFSKGLPTRASLKSLSPSTARTTHPITPSLFFPFLPDGKTPDFVKWFHYEGSLTGYPFSEDVSWFVMKNLAAVDTSQTTELNEWAEHHARELQPLDRRLVVRSFV